MCVGSQMPKAHRMGIMDMSWKDKSQNSLQYKVKAATMQPRQPRQP